MSFLISHLFVAMPDEHFAFAAVRKSKVGDNGLLSYLMRLATALKLSLGLHKLMDVKSLAVISVKEICNGRNKSYILLVTLKEIEKGERHGGTRPSSHAAFFWFHFTLDEPLLTPTFSHPQSTERLFLIAKELMHYSESEGYPPDCADCIAKVILHEIEYKRTEEHPTVAEVKEWIRKNRTAGITASACAANFGYNEDYLNRLFKKHLGKGLKEYINETRITYIKSDLMMGGITLTEVAAKYGFPEYKYFSKYFKYHEKMTPAEYRKTYYKMHTN